MYFCQAFGEESIASAARPGRPQPPPISAMIRQSFLLSATLQAAVILILCGLAACRTPVHTIEPGSACNRLRASYPSQHGLILFTETTATVLSIPWCFPATKGFGVHGYTINIPVERPGTFSLVLSDIRPPTQFHLTTIAGGCAEDNTCKSNVYLGAGTEWALTLAGGNHCFSLFKAENEAEDVWFTLTATRP